MGIFTGGEMQLREVKGFGRFPRLVSTVEI